MTSMKTGEKARQYAATYSTDEITHEAMRVAYIDGAMEAKRQARENGKKYPWQNAGKKLPPPHTDVLVRCQNERHYIARYYNGMWHIDSPDYDTAFEIVSHWMSIPTLSTSTFAN